MAGQERGVRVLTFNCWGGFWAKRRKERIPLIAEEIQKQSVDLVALQEVWAEEDRTKLVAAGNGCGLKYSHVFSGSGTGSGLLYLSRFPLVDCDFWQYTTHGRPQRFQDAQYYGDYGIACATLQTPSGPVDVISTLFAANYDHTGRDDQGTRIPEDTFAPHRCSQALQLAQTVTRIKRHPLIVLGTFHARPNQLEVRLFESLTQLVDAFAMMCPGNPGYTVNSTDNSFMKDKDPKERVDYIWFSDDLMDVTGAGLAFTSQCKARCSYSKHFGVFANLRFTASEGAAAPAARPASSVLAQYPCRLLRVASALVEQGANKARGQHRSARMLLFLVILVAVGVLPLFINFSGEFGVDCYNLLKTDNCALVPLVPTFMGGCLSALFGFLVCVVLASAFARKQEAAALTATYRLIEQKLDAAAGFD